MKDLTALELSDINGGKVEKPSDLDKYNPVKWYNKAKEIYTDCKDWGQNVAGDFFRGVVSGYSKVFKLFF